MKRFTFLFVLGALSIVGGQVALSLGAHPEHSVAPRVLIQGSLALVLGSAVVASGMLGMAEGYEKVAERLARLLGVKRPGNGLELTVRSPADLSAQTNGFWKAYRSSALAVCLFLGGVLGLSVALSGTDYLPYLAALGLGIAVFGLVALVLGARALGRMRKSQRTVENSAAILDEQPDRVDEAPAPLSPEPAARWVMRRHRIFRTPPAPSRSRPAGTSITR